MELSLILSIISLCIASGHVGFCIKNFSDWMQKRYVMRNPHVMRKQIHVDGCQYPIVQCDCSYRIDSNKVEDG